MGWYSRDWGIGTPVITGSEYVLGHWVASWPCKSKQRKLDDIAGIETCERLTIGRLHSVGGVDGSGWTRAPALGNRTKPSRRPEGKLDFSSWTSSPVRLPILSHFGGIKQSKCMVFLLNFPNSALFKFGLVIYTILTPACCCLKWWSDNGVTR